MHKFAVRVFSRSAVRNVVVEAPDKRSARRIVRSGIRANENVGKAWQDRGDWIHGGQLETAELR